MKRRSLGRGLGARAEVCVCAFGHAALRWTRLQVPGRPRISRQRLRHAIGVQKMDVAPGPELLET